MCLLSEVLALPSERSWLSLAVRAHHSPFRGPSCARVPSTPVHFREGHHALRSVTETSRFPLRGLDTNSAAARAGIRDGDTIVEVKVMLLGLTRGHVRVGNCAPRNIPVHRADSTADQASRVARPQPVLSNPPLL